MITQLKKMKKTQSKLNPKQCICITNWNWNTSKDEVMNCCSNLHFPDRRVISWHWIFFSFHWCSFQLSKIKHTL